MMLLDYLRKEGYKPVDGAYYNLIGLWRAWYRGKVDRFHSYTIYNAGMRLKRERASLNMAKQGCEYWADLLWNRECAINLKDPSADKIINQTLQDNDFWRQTNVLIERAWAMGCGAYIAYEDKRLGRTVIDYVTAENVYPLAWHNDEVDSCAFAGTYNEGLRKLLYLMIHEKQPGGGYVVKNRFFERSESGSLTPCPTPESIAEIYTTTNPLFAIVKPNIANNIDDVPMGVSVYANCIDTLKSIDLAYDGAKTAMEIGRPRIGVSANMFGIDLTTGEPRYVFDPSDIAVYDLGFGSEATAAVETKDLTVPYRAADYERSLQTQLTVYSQAIGLGEKSFRWQQEALRTATEVISTDSTMLRAMEKHQDGLRSSITRIVRAVLALHGLNPEQEIAVVFDDSATRNKQAEAQEAWAWVVAFKYPFWKFLVDFKGYDETEAKTIEKEAASAYQPVFPGEE